MRVTVIEFKICLCSVRVLSFSYSFYAFSPLNTVSKFGWYFCIKLSSHTCFYLLFYPCKFGFLDAAYSASLYYSTSGFKLWSATTSTASAAAPSLKTIVAAVRHASTATSTRFPLPCGLDDLIQTHFDFIYHFRKSLRFSSVHFFRLDYFTNKNVFTRFNLFYVLIIERKIQANLRSSQSIRYFGFNAEQLEWTNRIQFVCVNKFSQVFTDKWNKRINVNS